MTSHLTELLGSRWPLLQAPMAGVQGSAMAVAVSNAGGLGALPAAMLSPAQLREELTRIKAQTTQPYNVNYFCHTPPTPDAARAAAWRGALQPFYDEAGIDSATVAPGVGRSPFTAEAADLLQAFRPSVVSFHFGLPAPELLAQVRGWGGKVLSSATTVEEALWLEAQGVDAVIAQGLEAGGHRGMFLTDDISSQMGTMALLPQVVRAVRVPVIAAGGIVDVASIRAALAMGAAGVQVGTAYLCADEASTSAIHRQALQGPAARHTALTRLFTGKPARGIMNRLMRELGPMSELAPAFPLATTMIGPLRAWAEGQGRGDFTPLWSGQNTSGCKALPAAEITRLLAQAWEA
ncbi:NAD(P)H-dependent flavin oxidoreductase [Variovorax sp. HJSM1_2]|uniref:NAD(P)H-dependent flavin oxidoreductase n=1 Tax=Variovorax sp. HJSM1_2 TaxID=3366263 RepID=UPI003BD59F0D